jgi:hypothetical protein
VGSSQSSADRSTSHCGDGSVYAREAQKQECGCGAGKKKIRSESRLSLSPTISKQGVLRGVSAGQTLLTTAGWKLADLLPR